VIRPGLLGRGGRVVDGVVDQVAHQLLQQRGVAVEHHARCAGLGAVVAQVDALLDGARHGLAHHLDGEPRQVAGLVVRVGAVALGARQRQQLVHRVRGALAGAADLLERLLQLVGIGALALRQVGLHAQARQRRLQLVRRVGQKALLRADGVVELVEQLVHRRHQRHHLQRHRGFVERAQVARAPLADARLHHRQRLDAAHQRQPDQQHRQRQDRELRQQHALDDLGRQHRLLLARLGQLQQRGRHVVGAAGNPQRGHAHRRGRALAVVQEHLVGRQRLVVRLGSGMSRSPLSSVPWPSSSW
jgi:hypothetical protein